MSLLLHEYQITVLKFLKQQTIVFKNHNSNIALQSTLS